MAFLATLPEELLVEALGSLRSVALARLARASRRCRALAKVAARTSAAAGRCPLHELYLRERMETRCVGNGVKRPLSGSVEGVFEVFRH